MQGRTPHAVRGTARDLRVEGSTHVRPRAADIAYSRTLSGWVCATFVIGVSSAVSWVGSLMTTSLHTALDMGSWTRRRVRRDMDQPVLHSDRGPMPR